ncbi:hypothetical protein [Amphibiibacter pelophylacis]|uniref:Uncharacterized protein n=1 Tax=Amphibiibacter pelophylacis TaxID=1799477 RepID=A0ACC6NZ96_9BURK
MSRRSRRQPDPALPLWQQGVYWAGVAAVVLVSAWALQLAWALWQADTRARPARAAIVSWSQGRPWTADQFLAAEKLLQQAQAITPDDASLYDDLASLYMLQGSQYDPDSDDEGDTEARRSLYQSALTTLLRSLQLRPQHGVTWANLALVAYELDPGSAQQWHAWHQALRFAPWEPASRALMAQVLLLSFENAPPEALEWFKTYRSMAPAAEFKRLQQFAQEYDLAPEAIAMITMQSSQ